MFKVNGAGRVANTPELKNISTKNGNTSLVDFSVMWNNNDSACSMFVKAFGKTAENIAKHFTKGDQIIIYGRLETWYSQQTNKNGFNVICESFDFGAKKQNATSSNDYSNSYTSNSTLEISDDDLPW